ncbi:unnamed protein product [Caenorhabditis nigoni]
MTNSNFSYISDNVTTALNINCKVQDDFQHELPKLLKHFSCSYSKWITLDLSISPHFEFVRVYESGFTNQDMSVYVEKVFFGELPNLIDFEAEIEELDHDEIASEVIKLAKNDPETLRLLFALPQPQAHVPVPQHSMSPI